MISIIIFNYIIIELPKQKKFIFYFFQLLLIIIIIYKYSLFYFTLL